MNKAGLIEMVAEKTGVPKKESEKVVTAFLDAITETLATSESVKLAGFGTFTFRKREAREGRNPATGQTMRIVARQVPVFKAAKALKDTVQ